MERVRDLTWLIDQSLAADPGEEPETVRALLLSTDSCLAHGQRLKLELDGYSVEVAADAGRALEVIRGDPPDLLFIDSIHSSMEGNLLLASLRDEPRLPVLPVLVIRAAPILGAQGWDGLLQPQLDVVELPAAPAGR